MMLTNVFQMRNAPDQPSVRQIKLSGLPVDEKRDRISFVQAIISNLNKMGVDATLAPQDGNGDISLISPEGKDLDLVRSAYDNFNPEFLERGKASQYEIEQAWQNRVRTHLSENGFQKVGRKYVKVDDILDDSSDFKEAYEIQAELIGGNPVISIDPCTRIMEGLSSKEVSRASNPEESIDVQVLPRWKSGKLVGRAGFNACDKSFEYHGESLATPKYWEKKHDIDFVEEDEEMLDVYIPDYDMELPYPASVVFGSFSRGRSLPDNLKKNPKKRVSEAAKAIEKYFNSISFAGEDANLSKLTTAKELGYETPSFGSSYDFDVRLGNDGKTGVNGIHKSLKRNGPYAGGVSGEYVVITPEDGREIRSGFEELADIYSQLNLGSISRCSQVGEDGIIEIGSKNSNSYANKITEIRDQLDAIDSDLIAFVVLPGDDQDVYFQARGKLFERLFGNNPVPAQAIKYSNVVKLANDNGYYVGVNTASQVYVKLGKVGSAVWILDEPADSHVPGVEPGSTCYAYHDVSRRPDRKSAATAYSATTDSHGRYIATGAQPTGGEKLTDENFHDILNELLRKVSAFHRRQETSGEKDFHFKRLVFAKDGKIGWKEQKMMKEVIRKGVPGEGKRPISKILDDSDLLPDDMIIDVVSVNKSPNKRVVARDGNGFANVAGGKAMIYNDDAGLLVSHKPERGTAKPLEITANDHISLNRDDVPEPTAESLLREYYNLSYLNWSSIFNQGKYALPQILTQNLGENLSAGIDVPDDMAMI